MLEALLETATQTVAPEDTRRYGIVALGGPAGHPAVQDVYRVADLVEKPPPVGVATRELSAQGLDPAARLEVAGTGQGAAATQRRSTPPQA